MPNSSSKAASAPRVSPRCDRLAVVEVTGLHLLQRHLTLQLLVQGDVDLAQAPLA
jgi:hypothetical protein